MFLDERTTDRLKTMKNGVVVILINTTNRFGNEEDIQDIRDVFENYYNSTVFLWKDMDLKELRENFYAVKAGQFWEDLLRKAEFLLAIALTNSAGDDRFRLADGKYIQATNGILKQFNKSDQLRRKTRWLIVQSMRGSKQTYHYNVICEGSEKTSYVGCEKTLEYRSFTKYTDYHYVIEGKRQEHHMKKFCEELRKLKEEN
ncbi:hypothetical protein DOY81_001261 [Sarcophaga bullata]|nr:hypothetical protein DOY81_001261 [Sarcophaga bullata]